MARTVKPAVYAAKRNEILDAAQRLVFTKGYERMTLQDILSELQISSGAFYHYFDSKPAVLEAFIVRIGQEVAQLLTPLVDDRSIPALVKLQRFFDTIDQLRIAHMDDIISLGRVWYTDANAIVRQKVDEAVRKQRAPLLAKIVQQGVQDGVFTTPYPTHAGDVILALMHGMGNIHAHDLLDPQRDHSEQHVIDNIVATHAAFMDAVERVVGAPEQSLHRTDAAAVRAWLAALHNDQPSVAVPRQTGHRLPN